MRTPRTTAVLLAAALAVSACSSGADAAELSVDDARSRMSPMVAGAAAVYLDIVNPTDEDDALVAATVGDDVAGSVELHETVEVTDDAMAEEGLGDDAMAEEGLGDDAMAEEGMGDDAIAEEGMGDDAMADDGMGDDAPMMRMQEVDRIDVPAGGTVTLEPGGLHLMLRDLVEDLEPGATFELTLVFEGAGELTVTVEVREDV